MYPIFLNPGNEAVKNQVRPQFSEPCLWEGQTIQNKVPDSSKYHEEK